MGLTMWDIWERAETGPICPTRKFETQIFFRKVQELVNKYGIKYDAESIVPTDDTLIDNVYQAGLELLLDVGVLCTDTERLIKFDEPEVKEALRLVPRELTIGQGKDAVIVAKREIEDKRLPVFMGGPDATPISEDIAIKVYEAYAREPSVDVLFPGSLTEVRGIPVKGGSPLEMHAEKMNVAMMREAFKRAGRPGLACFGPISPTAAGVVGACNPEWGYRKGDRIDCHIMPEMKVNYNALCMAEHCHHHGIFVCGGGDPVIGGLPGGPEGAAITSVAETLMMPTVYLADMCGIGAIDALYAPGFTARKPLWATSLALAAMARHTNFLCMSAATAVTYAGPCTDMSLYEIAAATITSVVCGADMLDAVGGRGGVETDSFGGPLDTRFMRDMAYAATKLNREEANEIVKVILAKYEDRVEARKVPIGKKFQECNDLKTLKPSKEFLDLYDKVKKELEGLGLEFE